MTGFFKFIKYNGIEDGTLKDAANNFGYMKVAKDVEIYTESECSKRYYGIIKGKVSIRTKKKSRKAEDELKNLIYKEDDSSLKETTLSKEDYKKKEEIHMQTQNLTASETSSEKSKPNHDLSLLLSLKTRIHKQNSFTPEPDILKTYIRNSAAKKFYNHIINKKLIVADEELIVLSDGMCFGDWTMSYDKKIKNSAHSIEACDIFYIDKNFFDQAFSRALAKAEYERKNFLQNVLAPLKKIPFNKFEHLYHKFVVNFFKKNEIIYKENDPAHYLYVVYQGECILKRDISKSSQEEKNVIRNDHNEDNKNFIHKNKNYKNILLLTKGGISGLEIAAGIDKLNNYLVSSNDDTVVLKIDIVNFAELKSEIISFLLPLYNENKKIMDNYVNSHINLKNNIKINFRNYSGFSRSNNKQEFSIKTNCKSKSKVNTKANTRKGTAKATKVESDEQKKLEENLKNYLINKSQNKSKSYNQFTYSSMEFFRRRSSNQSRYQEKPMFNTEQNKIKINFDKKVLENYYCRTESAGFISKTIRHHNIGKIISKFDDINININTNSNNINMNTNCFTAKNSPREFKPQSTDKKRKSFTFFKLNNNLIKNNQIKVIDQSTASKKKIFTFNSGRFNLPMVSLDEYKLNSNTETSPLK